MGGVADMLWSMRRLLPVGVAFCVMTGFILGRFAGMVAPADYLTRPLVVVLALSVVVGVVCLFVPRHAALAAAVVGALLVAPVLWGLLVVSIAAVALLAERMAERSWDLTQAVAVMAAVFLIGGVVRVAPLVPFEAVAHAAEALDGPSTYVVLLDGYPRIDTLAELGYDNSGFIAELQVRGFDHYPDAHSAHSWTYRTLTAMFTGEDPEDSYGTLDDRRSARDGWHLPADFAVVPPPIGYVTIPHSRDISGGGITNLEIGVLRQALIGQTQWVGDLVMTELRRRLEADLTVLEETTEPRVFAHLLAPHAPFLYGDNGEPLPAPRCWPDCSLFSPGTGHEGLEGTLDYLNRRIIDMVDHVISRDPETVIVLFSDHGGRFDLSDQDEWHRSFLAARTPGHPGWFASAPRPDQVLRLMEEL